MFGASTRREHTFSLVGNKSTQPRKYLRKRALHRADALLSVMGAVGPSDKVLPLQVLCHERHGTSHVRDEKGRDKADSASPAR